MGGVGRHGIEHHVAVVPLAGNDQIGAVLVLVNGHAFHVVVQQLAETGNFGQFCGLIFCGRKGPDADAFLADEQLLAGIVSHAAFGLGLGREVANSLGGNLAVAAIKPVLNEASVLVVGDGVDNTLRALRHAQTIDVCQLGRHIAQTGSLAACRVNGEQFQAVAVAVGSNGQINLALA